MWHLKKEFNLSFLVIHREVSSSIKSTIQSSKVPWLESISINKYARWSECHIIMVGNKNQLYLVTSNIASSEIPNTNDSFIQFWLCNYLQYIYIIGSSPPSALKKYGESVDNVNKIELIWEIGLKTEQYFWYFVLCSLISFKLLQCTWNNNSILVCADFAVTKRHSDWMYT